MTYTTDNRWSPGASGAAIPDDSPAAYSARWIDRGDEWRADVLGDRQGLAYNDEADRDRLISRLSDVDKTIRDLLGVQRERRGDHGVVTLTIDNYPRDGEVLFVARRRVDGYVYVDAWLDTIKEAT